MANQVEEIDGRRRIVEPLTNEQLSRVYNYLAPSPVGLGCFVRFIFAASDLHWEVNDNGEETKLVSGPGLFDLSKLVCLLELEIVGLNNDGILSLPPEFPSRNVDPDLYEIRYSINEAISRQVIQIVRKISASIRIIHNPGFSFGHGPRLLLG